MIRTKSRWAPSRPALHPPVIRLSRPFTQRLAAATLLAASALLDRLARRLAAAADRRSGAFADPAVEFHAQAGAPEGALYVDGQLVGWLQGVKRL